MCGRYTFPHLTQAQMLKLMRDFLDGPFREEIDEDAPQAVDSYNVKPTQQVQIQYVEGEVLVATTARWWFVPHWHKGDLKEWKATTFNARLETAREKPVFRTAWAKGRCVIAATGYYEWTGEKGKKQPWLVELDSNQPVMFFAGLWSALPDGVKTCTILTRDAASQVREVHHRMPVILSTDQIEPWLTGKATDAEVLEQFGAGLDGRFKLTKVRPFGMKDDGPALLMAYEPEPDPEEAPLLFREP